MRRFCAPRTSLLSPTHPTETRVRGFGGWGCGAAGGTFRRAPRRRGTCLLKTRFSVESCLSWAAHGKVFGCLTFSVA